MGAAPEHQTPRSAWSDIAARNPIDVGHSHLEMGLAPESR